MLKNVLCGLCMLVATVAASSAQAEKWAALNPNSELSSHVFWGPTKNAAEDQARAECLRLSTTCSSRPANTNAVRQLPSKKSKKPKRLRRKYLRMPGIAFVRCGKCYPPKQGSHNSRRAV
jgi:hypothetical protein